MAISQDQFDRLARELPGFGRDPASIRRRVEAMESLLEGLFVIPGTTRRVGLDSLVGLIPIVGDLATAAMGAWIVWEARNLGMSKWQITRMSASTRSSAPSPLPATCSTSSTNRTRRTCASSTSISTATTRRPQ
jgi:hypothetical protein